MNYLIKDFLHFDTVPLSKNIHKHKILMCLVSALAVRTDRLNGNVPPTQNKGCFCWLVGWLVVVFLFVSFCLFCFLLFVCFVVCLLLLLLFFFGGLGVGQDKPALSALN